VPRGCSPYIAYTGMCRWTGYGFRQTPLPPQPRVLVAPAHRPQPRKITTLATMSVYLYQTLY